MKHSAVIVDCLLETQFSTTVSFNALVKELDVRKRSSVAAKSLRTSQQSPFAAKSHFASRQGPAAAKSHRASAQESETEMRFSLRKCLTANLT